MSLSPKFTTSVKARESHVHCIRYIIREERKIWTRLTHTRRPHVLDAFLMCKKHFRCFSTTLPLRTDGHWMGASYTVGMMAAGRGGLPPMCRRWLGLTVHAAIVFRFISARTRVFLPSRWLLTRVVQFYSALRGLLEGWGGSGLGCTYIPIQGRAG